jgi:predicted SnoaL-like aldol condensation-catalyzing enzyme
MLLAVISRAHATYKTGSAADIVRLKNRILVEHWDVIQDEATKQQSKSGTPMFGDSFPK